MPPIIGHTTIRHTAFQHKWPIPTTVDLQLKLRHGNVFRHSIRQAGESGRLGFNIAHRDTIDGYSRFSADIHTNSLPGESHATGRRTGTPPPIFSTHRWTLKTRRIVCDVPPARRLKTGCTANSSGVPMFARISKKLSSLKTSSRASRKKNRQATFAQLNVVCLPIILAS